MQPHCLPGRGSSRRCSSPRSIGAGWLNGGPWIATVMASRGRRRARAKTPTIAEHHRTVARHASTFAAQRTRVYRTFSPSMAMLDGARIFHVNVNCSRSRRARATSTSTGADSPTACAPRPTHVQSGAAFGLDHARWDAWILVGPSGFDGGAIDLLEWQEPHRPVRAPAALSTTPGFQRIGFVVADLDAAIARVAAHGGTVWSEPLVHDVRRRQQVRIVFVNDPDGTTIELVEGEVDAAVVRRGHVRRPRTLGRVLHDARLPRARRASRAAPTTARTCTSTDRSRWPR